MSRRFFKSLSFFIILFIFFTFSLGNSHETIKIKSKDIDITEDILAQMDVNETYASETDDMANEKLAVATQIKQNQVNQEWEQKKLEEAEQKRLTLENQIKAYLGKNINNVGLSYYDINSGRKIIINGDKVFIAASTSKVQMNMILADLYKNGQINPNESLRFTEDCYQEGTGILQDQDLSNPLALKLLTEYSIKYSDNIATNMIKQRIGYENMRDLIDAKLGHATDHSDNYTTANDETSLLIQLYNNSASDPYYDQLIQIMKNTVFHDRLDYYLPHDIVAHKIGNLYANAHDIGIIYTNSPYIISIYTDNLSNPSEVIADISKMIYEYQNTLQ